MDVPTLILLGAAGGLLRGAVDLYARFVCWQADRKAHRQAIAAGMTQEEAPQFQGYFDAPVDFAAAVVHTTMGAGAAVLFGTTGQISGEYAALVVGMSAPVLLTQLIRIQTVNEAVTGERQPAGVQEVTAEPGALPAAGASGRVQGVADLGTSGAGAVVAPTAGALRAEPQPAPSASHSDQVQLPASAAEDPPSVARPMPSPRPSGAVADARTPERASGEMPADRSQPPGPSQPADGPFPADPASGTGTSRDGRSAPRWQRTELGEEGL
ncbi:hypothetical protein [Streptomyces sp. S.PB5]|uniref:hypothetical protein n=1 Tax=Streptomyces sp. S.PB5 TaxID=3020844 RepID=UPI0025B06682|nr:hypothetical protein [Streptomyces sp. S.PB5]MDN3028382.1 hypothetical protein [Streptomyces sp. S.PB5]